MEAIETRYPNPTTRVELHYDEDCRNPLTEWDHGVELRELPNASRTARDYLSIDSFSNVYAGCRPLDIDFDTFRPFWEDWDNDTAQQHMVPMLKTFLNRHCAAWGTIDRDSYTGELKFYLYNTEFESSDGIAFVSRPNFLQGWHGKPEGTRLTKRLRTMAEEGIKAVIDEYNSWATGDCYGYTVETHNPGCPYCEDRDDPDTDCPCWDATGDSCWGLIGHDYAHEELERVEQSYATPEEQPVWTPS